jgi:hypothetical protein
MDAAHIPGLDHEEPEFWIEDDIPKSDADLREENERARAAEKIAERGNERGGSRDNPRE